MGEKKKENSTYSEKKKRGKEGRGKREDPLHFPSREKGGGN